MHTGFAAILALVGVAASASEAKEEAASPLAICDPSPAGRTNMSDIRWSANCLVKAIRLKDREAIMALTWDGGLELCQNGEFCHGFERPLFDPTVETGRFAGLTSFRGMLTRARRIDIAYDGSGDLRLVRFIANPARWKQGTARERRDYFQCSFRFDDGMKIWRVYNGFCFVEGDGWMLDWGVGTAGPQP